MNNFPFFGGFPYNNYYRPYNRYSNHHYVSPNNNYKENVNDNKQENNICDDTPKKEENRKSSNYTTFGPIIFNSSSFSDLEQPVLEILGLKLYLDDLIILALLFFLYKEDVKDEILFIALILLLLS